MGLSVAEPPSSPPRPDLSFVRRNLHDTAGPLDNWAQHVRGVPTGLIGNSLGGFAIAEAVKIDQPFTTIAGLAPRWTPRSRRSSSPPCDLRHMMTGATGDMAACFTTTTKPFFGGLPVPAYLVRLTRYREPGSPTRTRRRSPTRGRRPSGKTPDRRRCLYDRPAGRSGATVDHTGTAG